MIGVALFISQLGLHYLKIELGCIGALPALVGLRKIIQSTQLPPQALKVDLANRDGLVMATVFKAPQFHDEAAARAAEVAASSPMA